MRPYAHRLSEFGDYVLYLCRKNDTTPARLAHDIGLSHTRLNVAMRPFSPARRRSLLSVEELTMIADGLHLTHEQRLRLFVLGALEHAPAELRGLVIRLITENKMLRRRLGRKSTRLEFRSEAAPLPDLE